MTLWDHLCCLGYGLGARRSGVWHWLRGHRLHWRDRIDLWTGCTGDIWCERCPDSSDGETDVVIWSRQWRWMMKVGEMICSVVGHPGWKHPQRWNGQNEPNDDEVDPIMVDVLDEWFCARCAASRHGDRP